MGRAGENHYNTIHTQNHTVTAHRVQRCRGFIFCLQRELAYGELLLRSVIKIPPRLFNCIYHLVVISSQRPVSTATAPARGHALAMAGSGATRAPRLGLSPRGPPSRLVARRGAAGAPAFSSSL